jgi:hypothetical protein
LIFTFLGGLFDWLLSSVSGSYSALGLLLINLSQKGKKSLSKIILLNLFTHLLSSSFKVLSSIHLSGKSPRIPASSAYFKKSPSVQLKHKGLLNLPD